VFGRREGERTRKGATVAGKSCGLSRRERSKPAEEAGAGPGILILTGLSRKGKLSATRLYV